MVFLPFFAVSCNSVRTVPISERVLLSENIKCMGGHVYSFAAMSKYHRLGGLNHRNLFSRSWRT